MQYKNLITYENKVKNFNGKNVEKRSKQLSYETSVVGAFDTFQIYMEVSSTMEEVWLNCVKGFYRTVWLQENLDSITTFDASDASYRVL